MALIAALQMAAGPNVPANLMEAGRLIKEAAARGARMVVLPETFAMMGADEADRVKIAETFGDGPIQIEDNTAGGQRLSLLPLASRIPGPPENFTGVPCSTILPRRRASQLAKRKQPCEPVLPISSGFGVPCMP